MNDSAGAERAILGTILLYPEMFDLVTEKLHSDNFTGQNRRTAEAMSALSHAGKGINEAILGAEYGIDALYMANLMTAAVHGEFHLKGMIDHVRDCSRRRLLRVTAEEIKYRLDKGDDVDDIMAEAEAYIMSIGETSTDRTPAIVELSHRVYEAAKYRKENQGKVFGVSTGFCRFDDLIGGLVAPRFIILGARPGTGKTALVLCVAKNAAEAGIPVLFFSLEMGNDELIFRLFCIYASVNTECLQAGYVNETDWQMVESARDQIASLPIHIQDRPALDIVQMQAMARRAVRRHGVGLVIVDYISLARAKQAKGYGREREVSAISAGLKQMAKQCNVPVLALAQLNREVEKRTVKRPQLSDLRESGSLEQDADQVMFLYHEHKYNKSKPANVIELNLAKNRHGRTGKIYLQWEPKFTRFSNLTHGEESWDE